MSDCCAINDKKENQLMVIWDLGRKCTFACSYCPPHRKNNWSDTANLDELISTAKGLERYHNTYNKHRHEPFKLSASFTGGEPTVNPAFFKFLTYLQEHYPHWKRTLTTNGFYSERKLRTVMANTDFTTVSWHCEATPSQKSRVRENLRIMHEEGYGFKVNVMFHAHEEYFDECVELCAWLDERGIGYTPRIIGDEGNAKVGLVARTVHEYTEEQMAWMKAFWDNKKKPKVVETFKPTQQPPPGVMGMIVNEPPKPKKVVGQTLGRPCCGGRPMEIKTDDGWERSDLLPTNNFQGWSCMVNWYFLYIHQEIDQVWHHQTCQVNLDGEVGPICKASELDQWCDKLDNIIETTGTMPYIRCPKTHCGCGMCTPKAKSDEDAAILFRSHSILEPQFATEFKEVTRPLTLKTMVLAFDKENGNETI